MKLSEGLAELRDNLLRDNAGQASGPDDKLWSDVTLVRYINDAQRRWARLTFTLRDNATPEVCEVVLETGITEYTLHKSVRAVISARYDTNTWDIRRVGHALLAHVVTDDDQPWPDATTETGAPAAYTTDESLDLEEDASVVLRVWGTPTADQDGKIIHLRVARMPLCDVDLAHPEKSFEIPDEFCLDMLEGAAWRAQRNSDIDGHTEMADKHKGRFDEAAAEQRKVIRSKMHVPIAFQFGGSGTSWGR